MQRLAQVVICGAKNSDFERFASSARARACSAERVLALQLLDQLLVLVAQADLRDHRTRLAIDEQQHIAEHGDPHHAERSVAVAAERDVTQRQQTEDRHGERVQRRREVRVRDDAERRATSEASGDQGERERLVGSDQYERRGAPDDAGDTSSRSEPPAPATRRSIAIARATIRT